LKKYTVNLKNRSYPIYVKPDIYKELPQLLSEYNSSQRWVIISQHKIMELFGYKLEKKLKENNFDCFNITLPNGETAKSIKEYNRAIEQMIDFGCDRKSIVIALGGGVVGDVSGFIASTFMRGIKYFQVPTTLLSMVDSSIGGKTGINTSKGKNLIGTIYQPKAVFIDQNFLKTLPKDEVVSGLGEIIKYGIVLDFKFFNKVRNWIKDLSNFPFEEAIEICCKLKSEIISKDEMDNGIRAVLNFGHTIGHALELKYGFNKLKHGEAVAYGMISASYISFRLKKISHEQYKLIFKTIRLLPLPTLDKLDVNEILTFIKRDKKYIKGKINFVTLKNIGSAAITKNIQNKLIMDSIKIL